MGRMFKSGSNLSVLLALGAIWQAAEAAPPEDSLPTDRPSFAFATSGPSVFAPTSRYSQESPFGALTTVPAGTILAEPHSIPSSDITRDSHP